MQLARILRPASRTWSGKLGQALWALRLERHLDKQAILE
jgi:membrane carboxypeptidase/penicillin-binding protein PbpC